MYHLIQRRCDQTGETNRICFFIYSGLQDFFGRHHNAKVDHFVVVALEDYAYDVLTNVVNVAFDRRHDNLALSLTFRPLFGLDERYKVCNGLFHNARALNNLRQEHLA